MQLQTRGVELRQHTIAVYCPHCGNKGAIVWEGYGEATVLVRMCDQFHERLAKSPPHDIELVCSRCGTLQRD